MVLKVRKMREKKNLANEVLIHDHYLVMKKLKNTFEVVNKGCDPEQIVSFIKKVCGKDIYERDCKGGEK